MNAKSWEDLRVCAHRRVRSCRYDYEASSGREVTTAEKMSKAGKMPQGKLHMPVGGQCSPFFRQVWGTVAGECWALEYAEVSNFQA